MPPIDIALLSRWNEFILELNNKIAAEGVTDQMLDHNKPFTIVRNGQKITYNTGKEYTDELLSKYGIKTEDVKDIQYLFNSMITALKNPIISKDEKEFFLGTGNPKDSYSLKYSINDLALDINNLSNIDGRVGSITEPVKNFV